MKQTTDGCIHMERHRRNHNLFLFISFGILSLQRNTTPSCESFTVRIPWRTSLKRYYGQKEQSLPSPLSYSTLFVVAVGGRPSKVILPEIRHRSETVCLSCTPAATYTSTTNRHHKKNPQANTSPSITNNNNNNGDDNNNSIKHGHDEIDVDNHTTHFTIEAIRNISLSLDKDDVMRLPSDERYRYRIKQLLEYNTTFGTLDVPYNYKNDIQFAKWVQSQRYEYRLLKCHKVGVKSYLTSERVRLLDSIGFPWNDYSRTEQEGLSNRWMSNWDVLKEYKQENGHVRVPEHCVYKGVKLGIWVKNQRRNAKIRPEDYRTKVRMEKLKELGFIWDTNDMGDTVYNATWMNRYEQVKTFYEKHGHLNVPKEETELALWIRTQRNLKQQLQDHDVNERKGSNGNNMPRQYLMERIQLLNHINFDWDGMKAIERERNNIWWKRYDELCRFHEYYGHTNIATVVKMGKQATNTSVVSECHVLEDIDLNRLHRWTKTQRVRYKQFQQCLSSNEDNDDDVNKIKSINQEKINALTQLGFVWDQREELWQSKFQQLKRFGEIHKHFNIPTTNISSSAFDDLLLADLKNCTDIKDREVYMQDIIDLGKWAHGQRFKLRKYKRGEQLSSRTKEHMRLLDEISFYNDTMGVHSASPEEKKLLWDTYFSALQEFQEQNGHCHVPFSQDDNSDQRHLHEWTTIQRRRFRSVIKRLENNRRVSQVDRNRLDSLKKIGFIFNIHDYKFEAGLSRLKEFYTKFGHSKVCPNETGADPHLYTFVRRQRHLYREREKGHINSLSDERIEKLARLDFVWNPRNSSEAEL
mmetsp:Transcript_15211/g.28617  ORF Transcript_15211/g.28617 Transcript_15211/m.28617 type:complete len:809 (-) Transcript_15211:6-2432(-)